MVTCDQKEKVLSINFVLFSLAKGQKNCDNSWTKDTLI